MSDRVAELESENARLRADLAILQDNAAKVRRTVHLAPVAGIDRKKFESVLGEETVRRSTLYGIEVLAGTRYLLVVRDSAGGIDYQQFSQTGATLRAHLGYDVMCALLPDGVEFTVLELPPPPPLTSLSPDPTRRWSQ